MTTSSTPAKSDEVGVSSEVIIGGLKSPENQAVVTPMSKPPRRQSSPFLSHVPIEAEPEEGFATKTKETVTDDADVNMFTKVQKSEKDHSDRPTPTSTDVWMVDLPTGDLRVDLTKNVNMDVLGESEKVSSSQDHPSLDENEFASKRGAKRKAPSDDLNEGEYFQEIVPQELNIGEDNTEDDAMATTEKKPLIDPASQIGTIAQTNEKMHVEETIEDVFEKFMEEVATTGEENYEMINTESISEAGDDRIMKVAATATIEAGGKNKNKMKATAHTQLINEVVDQHATEATSSSAPSSRKTNTFHTHLHSTLPPTRTHNNTKKLQTLTSALTLNTPQNQNISHYWETIGKCKPLSGFSWSHQDPSDSQPNTAISFDPIMGRAYHSAFTLEGTHYKVGEFVWSRTLTPKHTNKSKSRSKFQHKDIVREFDSDDGMPKIFRIVGLFQATKSFRGVWAELDFQNPSKQKLDRADDIQKRGHAYMQVVPFYPRAKLPQKENSTGDDRKKWRRRSGLGVSKKSKKRRKSTGSTIINTGNEVDIDIPDYVQAEVVLEYNPNPHRIFWIPFWIGLDQVVYEKVSIIDLNRNSKGNHIPNLEPTVFGCRYALTRYHNINPTKEQKKKPLLKPLDESQQSILQCSASPLEITQMYSPNQWAPILNAEQVQFIRRERKKPPTELVDDVSTVPFAYNQSSDDSDGFYAEEDIDDKSINDDPYDTEEDESEEEEEEGQTLTVTTKRLNKKIDPPEKRISDCLLAIAKKPNLSEVLPRLVFSGNYVDIDTQTVQTQKDKEVQARQDFQKMLEKNPRFQDLAEVSQAQITVNKKLRYSREIQQFVRVMPSEIPGHFLDDQLNTFRTRLGFTEFRKPQRAVCVSAMLGYDVIYIAPTGHGKSLCFSVPALKANGVVLIIEPFKSIIADQVRNFQAMGRIRAEALKSIEDVRVDGGFRAEQRLTQIANRMDHGKELGALLLFCTPELAIQPNVLIQLRRIYMRNKLSRFVLDEFDMKHEANENYRQAYDELLPALKTVSLDVPFTLLSATTKREDLLDSISYLHSDEKSEEQRPHFFTHDRPISDSLCFSVERKVSEAQVGARIAHILKSYGEAMAKKPQCICYCFTRANCKKMADILNEKGFVAEAVTSVTGNREAAIESLRSGKTQIICATRVIGRGVDIPNVRFLFHTTLPSSLDSYVQETGRAGRDNICSYCILFYRPHDRTVVERVVGISPQYGLAKDNTLLTGKNLKKAEYAIDQVIQYATCGDTNICRYAMLASNISLKETESSIHMCQSRVQCDHCQMKKGIMEPIYGLQSESRNVIEGYKMRLETVNINPFVLSFLKKFDQISVKNGGGGALENQIPKLIETVIDDLAKISKDRKFDMGAAAPQEKSPCPLATLNSGSFQKSLKNDFIRLLETYKLVCHKGIRLDKKVCPNTSNIIEFRKKIKTGQVNVLLRYVRQFHPEGEEDHSMKNMHTKIEPNFHHPEEVPVPVVATAVEDKLTPPLFDANKQPENFVSNRVMHEKIYESFGNATQNGSSCLCPCLVVPTKILCILMQLPFLVQFELWRLHNERSQRLTSKHLENNVREKFLEASLDWNNRYKALQFLHGLAGSSMGKYGGVLKASCKTGAAVDKGVGSVLYFSAKYGDAGEKLELLSPDLAADRRIYRKFGSHRFLDVLISESAKFISVGSLSRKHVDNPLWVCGRRYTFLWAKATKSPQCFVFFAEAGLGIPKEDEMISDKVRYWCLPLKINPELTLGKEQKRMKLSFSKTSAAGKLPPNSIQLVDDFISKETGAVMTDGCGLVSREALDFIWTAYESSRLDREKKFPKDVEIEDIGNEDILIDENESNDSIDIQERCPFTSFQGRIGGFKGMWALDGDLEGIQIKCRESQRKYNLPMKSLQNMSDIYQQHNMTPREEDFDDAYDVVDVCNWDKGPEDGRLSLRLIQVLHHRGLSIDFLKKCVDQGTEWLTKLNTGGTKDLLEYIGKRYNSENRLKSREDNDMFEDDLIVRMAQVNVPRNEPVFSKLLEKTVRKEAEAMRKKAKYPLKRCVHLRMIPDHTQLLEEGEAYIATSDRQSDVGKAASIVAMRSPIYFSGDLLKLKLVNIRALNARAMQKGVSDLFFRDLSTGLILSTKGRRSAADMMSGGDFDGDKAWTCWDPTLVDQISDYPPVDTSTDDFDKQKSALEQKLVKDTMLYDRISHAWHFRRHHNHLCALSVLLDALNDCYGCDSIDSIAVGTQAFLQVDHPFDLCELPKGFQDLPKRVKFPHWHSSSSRSDRSYKSKEALGVLWDYMEEKMRQCTGNKNEEEHFELNHHIMKHVIKMDTKAENDEDTQKFMQALRKEMKESLLSYNNDLKEKMTNQVTNNDLEPEIWEWMKKKHRYWSNKLIKCRDSEDSRWLATAVLYEQASKCSFENSHYNDGETKAYRFAWYVAHDYLTRMIADGEAQVKGSGAAPTFARDNERVLFSNGRKKK